MRTKTVFIPKSVIDEALKLPRTPGKKALQSFQDFCIKAGIPAGKIAIIDNMAVPRFGNPTEIHDLDEDFWIGLEEMPFICGGTPVNLQKHPSKEREWKADSIKGGVEGILQPGGFVWIPAGEPHTHYGTARAVVLKIPAIRGTD